MSITRTSKTVVEGKYDCYWRDGKLHSIIGDDELSELFTNMERGVNIRVTIEEI